MPQNVNIFDLRRIFIGDLPWTFTLEIVFRTSFLYIYALLLVRLIGKRGLKELAIFEYIVIFALGSAVGDPMFYPEIPLLHGMTVLTTIVLLQRGLQRVLQANERLHEFVYPGRPACLVTDGLINLADLKRERLQQEDLFMLLRETGIQHLGEVKRAFLEPTGDLSVWRFEPKEVRPGLTLDPEPEGALRAGDKPGLAGEYSCTRCGGTVSLPAGQPAPACHHCSNPEWLRSAHTDASPADTREAA